MKRIAVLAFLILAGGVPLLAQTGVQVSYLSPQSGLQYRLKPTVGVQVFQGLRPKMDGHFRLFVSAGFSSSRPLPDTFRIYYYDRELIRGGVKPAWQVVRSVVAVPVAFSLEYNFLEKRTSPMAGMDVSLTAVVITHDYRLSSSTVTGQKDDFWMTGFTPKVGVNYNVNQHLVLTGGMGRTFGQKGALFSQTHLQTFLRGVYYFKSHRKS
jgi:hypothetical protein